MNGSAQRGFTLLEILTVFTVLAFIFAMLVPLFRYSYSNLQVRNAARNFAATLRFAQEQAIVQGREYRLCIDRREAVYWVSRQADPAGEPDTFVRVYSDAIGPTRFPDSVRLRSVAAASGREGRKSIKYIACYPNGRVAKAEVSLRGPDRRRFTVRTTPRMGGVQLLESRS